MKKTIIPVLAIIAVAGLTSGLTSTNTVENTSNAPVTENVCSNDSNKTIYYEVQGEVYRSQFYNTTQAIVIENFNNKDIRELFTPWEIEYLSEDGRPTMDEIQLALAKQQTSESFWDVLSDLYEDAKYLSVGTKYQDIYFDNPFDAYVYKTSSDSAFHILSQE